MEGTTLTRAARAAKWRPLPTGLAHEVSGFELLFDVITAFAFSQIAREVLATPDAVGVLRAVVILSMLWGCWMNYCWVANSVRADAGAIRTLHAVALGGMVVCGLTVAEAFAAPGLTSRAVVFLAAYLVIRCTSAVALWLAQPRTAGRRALIVLGAAAGTAAAIAVSTQLAGTARAGCWLLALAGEAIAAAAFARGWQVASAEHLAGRYGFIMSIGLEMSLGGIAMAAFGHPVTIQLLVLIGAALTLAVLLWWLYFDTLHLYARHKIRRPADGLSGSYQRDHDKLAYLHYSFLHMLLLAGMIGFGLTMQHIALTIIAPGSPSAGVPLQPLWTSCLAGGIALYLATTAVMWLLLDGSLHLSNLVIAVAVLAAAPFARYLPELDALAGVTVLGLVVLIAHFAVPRHRTHRLGIRDLASHAIHQHRDEEPAVTAQPSLQLR